MAVSATYPYLISICNLPENTTENAMYSLIAEKNVVDISIDHPKTDNPENMTIRCKTQHIATLLTTSLNNKIWKGYILEVYSETNKKLPSKKIVTTSTITGTSAIQCNKPAPKTPSIYPAMCWSKKYGYHLRKRTTVIETYKIIKENEIVEKVEYLNTK